MNNIHNYILKRVLITITSAMIIVAGFNIFIDFRLVGFLIGAVGIIIFIKYVLYADSQVKT